MSDAVKEDALAGAADDITRYRSRKWGRRARVFGDWDVDISHFLDREWPGCRAAILGESIRRLRFDRFATSAGFSVPGARTSSDWSSAAAWRRRGGLDFATCGSLAVAGAWKNSLSLDGADLSFRRGGRYASSTATPASAHVVLRQEPAAGVVLTRRGLKTWAASQRSGRRRGFSIGHFDLRRACRELRSVLVNSDAK